MRVESRDVQGIGHDLLAANITLLGGGSTLDCAFKICDVLGCAWSQQLGVTVFCEATPDPNDPDNPNRAKIQTTKGVWAVPYAMLFTVLDGEQADHRLIPAKLTPP